MAGLVLIPLEIGAEWLLAALGITAVGTTAVVLSRTGSKDETDAPAIPDTATRTRTRTCKQCPPDCGSLVTRNWNMSDVSRAYQARVTGFAPGTEWSFAGNDFDGFRSGLCQLEEAKAKYDQFFDDDSGEPKMFWRAFGEPKIIQQAQRHSGIVAANPPSRAVWYFMQPMSYRYFARRFSMVAPLVASTYEP